MPPARIHKKCCGALVVAFTLVGNFCDRVHGRQLPRTQVASDLTFESFLQHPPVISSARFQMEQLERRDLYSPVASLPEQGQSQKRGNNGSRVLPQFAPSLPRPARSDTACIPVTYSYQVKLDGENYLLARLNPGPGSGSGGYWNQTRWKTTGESEQDTNIGLVLADLQINPSNALFVNHKICKELVRNVANLGIYEMIPGSTIWREGDHHFSALYEDPESLASSDDATSSPLRLEVDLTYSNNVPATASVTMDSGRAFTVVYKYSALFFAGRFPVELSRYFDFSRGEDGRAYTIRFEDLALGQGPLPVSELDPLQALGVKFTSTIVWSNGVRYNSSPQGLSRIRTSAEIAAIIAKQRGLSLRSRVALLLFLTLPAVYLVVHTLKHRT